MKKKFIELPQPPTSVTCHICHKEQPMDKLLNLGNGVFRCKSHRQATILKAGNSKINHETAQPAKRSWIITIPAMTIRVEEGT